MEIGMAKAKLVSYEGRKIVEKEDSKIQGKKPEFRTFLFEGDEYFDIRRIHKTWPRITGLPEIFSERTRSYIADKQKYRHGTVPVMAPLHAPRYCYIGRLINWPFVRMGGPQCSVTGTYGTGKSNLMNLIVSMWLACRLNIRVLMFNDRRMEFRNLAAHGYFDAEGSFHPFQIDVWFPKGYEWLKGAPLWETRKNVTIQYFENSDNIVDSMKPHKLTVVYDECFDPPSKLKLWIDMMEIIGEQVTPSKNYVFAHHEFSSLIAEVPHKQIYALTQQAANIALNLRKDRIGMISTFHMPTEVFYRVSQKFGYVLIKRPVRRKNMSYAEIDAKNFPITDVNITRGGRWMTHTIMKYPELPDRFRVIPKRIKWVYPELEPIDKHLLTAKEQKLYGDPTNIQIMRLRAEGIPLVGSIKGEKNSELTRKSIKKNSFFLF
jgi:hypothetical protein